MALLVRNLGATRVPWLMTPTKDVWLQVHPKSKIQNRILYGSHCGDVVARECSSAIGDRRLVR